MEKNRSELNFFFIFLIKIRSKLMIQKLTVEERTNYKADDERDTNLARETRALLS